VEAAARVDDSFPSGVRERATRWEGVLRAQADRGRVIGLVEGHVRRLRRSTACRLRRNEGEGEDVTDRWLTVKEAAARVKRSEATIYRWIRDGDLIQPMTRVPEEQLLKVDVEMREKRGRPRKNPR
jgi:excisionase family DNA binding protein